MPLFSFEGKSPQVHPDAFIAPTATLIGDVIVEAGASVWYNAVLRADFSQVIVREGANIQDGAVLHAPPGLVCEIGPGATVAHLCCVHGATVGAEAMIANGAIVLDGAKVGRRTMVASGALVVGGTELPDEVIATGSPAKVKSPIAGTAAQFWIDVNPNAYQELARRHAAGVEPVDEF
ncbi:gamma carbonic anhydrase family protein [Nocardia higoensis]|uniref:gamma carbonic anhydrase family protein n=1 Tax=Nocardia higoensis TaxID=228599 RepID=UPI000311EA09|nr:gamma carbonic anhydrase family protein [Nocardia higoensis]